MTGAFARAMDLNVPFQQVATEEMWSRCGGMYFMSGHVNVASSSAATLHLGRFERSVTYTIDFMPQPSTAADARAAAVASRRCWRCS